MTSVVLTARPTAKQWMGAENFAQKGSQALVDVSSPAQLVYQAGQPAADLHSAAADAAEQSDPDSLCLPAVANQHL